MLAGLTVTWMSVPASALQMGHMSMARWSAASSSSCPRSTDTTIFRRIFGIAVAARFVRNQVQLGRRIDRRRLDLLFLQRRGKRHCQASRLRGKKKLLRVGLAVSFESTVVGEGRHKRSAADPKCPAAFSCRPGPGNRRGPPQGSHNLTSIKTLRPIR